MNNSFELKMHPILDGKQIKLSPSFLDDMTGLLLLHQSAIDPLMPVHATFEQNGVVWAGGKSLEIKLDIFNINDADEAKAKVRRIVGDLWGQAKQLAKVRHNLRADKKLNTVCGLPNLVRVTYTMMPALPNIWDRL